MTLEKLTIILGQLEVGNTYELTFCEKDFIITVKRKFLETVYEWEHFDVENNQTYYSNAFTYPQIAIELWNYINNDIIDNSKSIGFKDIDEVDNSIGEKYNNTESDNKSSFNDEVTIYNKSDLINFMVSIPEGQGGNCYYNYIKFGIDKRRFREGVCYKWMKSRSGGWNRSTNRELLDDAVNLMWE